MRKALTQLPKAELVELIREATNLNGYNLADVELAGVNLARATVSGARFGNADFTGAYLQGLLARRTFFGGATLSGAVLLGAALEGAGFRRADLTAANLQWADLREANLIGADLTEAHLFDAKLMGAVMTDTILENARLDSARLDNANLQGAILERAVLHGASLREADLKNADLRRADLRGADLGGSALSSADLSGAIYDDSTVFPDYFRKDDCGLVFLGPGAVLPKMDLQGFDFKGEDVSGANLSYADLRGADLRGTDLTDADLSGVRLRRALYDNNTKFPRAFRPDARGAYAVVAQAKIRFAKMSWKHLRGAELSGAELVGAELIGADLSDGQLNSIDLTRANLYSANLRNAEMHGAVLSHTNAKGAVFHGADLRRADMRNADLSWADLAEADLRGARLTHAQLDGAHLRGARYSKDTQLPAGLDPVKERMLSGEGGVDVVAAREAAEAAATPVVATVPPVTRAARQLLGDMRRCGQITQATFRRLVEAVANTAVAHALYDWVAKGVQSGVAPAVGAAGASVAIILGVAGIYGSAPVDVVRRVATEVTAPPVSIEKPLASAPVAIAPEDNLLAMGALIGGSGPIRVDYTALRSAPAVDTSATMLAMATPPVEEALDTQTEPTLDDAPIAPVEPVVASAGPTVIPSAPPIAAAPIDAVVRPVEPVVALAGPTVVPSSPPVAAVPDEPTVTPVEPVVASAPPANVAVSRPVAAPAEAPDTGTPAVAAAPTTTTPVEVAAVSQTPVPATPPVVAAPEIVASAPEASEVDEDVMVALAPVAAAVAVDPEITAAVDQWRGAWESRDVDSYLDLYHSQASGARSGGSRRSTRRGQFSKVNLQARVENMFSEYDRIEVNVENLAVSREGDLMVSTFDQDLSAWRSDSDAAPDYVDHGKRTLVLAQDAGSDWRIVSEQWKPTQ
jgi:uncharacterized protein YjbI with pentapeptide repeats/ketosteroid isomerase-like protein